MATITLKNIDPNLAKAIKVAASRSGLSVEQEIRETLSRTYGSGGPLLDALADIRLVTGGVELELPDRIDLGRTTDIQG